MSETNSSRSGVTRVDALVLLGCVFLLGLVWLRPLLAASAARNDAVVCANNLRMVGQAFHVWWQTHEERSPWYTPVGWPEESSIWRGNLWFQFFWVSNELHSPRYLADPADDRPNLNTATSWGTEPGGFLHPAQRNNAVSYFFGVHATPLQPQTMLAGDGNILGGGEVGCSSTLRIVTQTLPQNARWPDNRHGNRGNLLFCDGAVEMTDTARLKEVAGWQGSWNNHILKQPIP